MKNRQKAVSIIIPTRNAKTTVLETLKSLKKQTYPIKEIIIIDNASKDNTISLVENYKKKTKLSIEIIKRKRNYGVGVNYNYVSKKAKSPLIVFMHSDSKLPSKNELAKLINPFLESDETIATYSTILSPRSVWETYNFWQKCLLVRSVDKELPGMNSKFDCHKKNIFQQIGGFDDVNFGEQFGVGSQDADLHMRLKKIGKVVQSEAKVVHLHYMGRNYKFSDWVSNRKLLAKSYGRLLRVRVKELSFSEAIFIIKPTLAVLPFIPGFQIIGIPLLIFYSLGNMSLMYTAESTRSDRRIFLLPFITILLLYYEVFWMFESFLFVKRNV